ncbi:DUF1413 domain-containing protein [Paracoccus sanguinis]|uniref:DUF1413 domain-containing protein n=1 Tax=Paracoccus sanguinis TaxID=1545044 RepID=UPI0012E0844D|nr:DUF1413 domain-containing protein [Paracoccus sanguinis]
MFEERYAEIPVRLAAQRPRDGFNLENLFTPDEWRTIGDGRERQRFGTRFANDVRRGNFPGVTRNEQRNDVGGNEARYNYNHVA